MLQLTDSKTVLHFSMHQKVLSLTGRFRQRRRWQRLVAVLHDGVARARARGRLRLTPGLRDVRGGCAADVATTTRIRFALSGAYYKQVRLPSIFPKLISRANQSSGSPMILLTVEGPWCPLVGL